jgi:hypothetical protein
MSSCKEMTQQLDGFGCKVAVILKGIEQGFLGSGF